MSTITNNKRSFTVSVIAIAYLSAGFINSVVAISITFIIPSLKPPMPYYTRRARHHSLPNTPTPIIAPRPLPIITQTLTTPPKLLTPRRRISFSITSPTSLLSRHRRSSVQFSDDSSTSSPDPSPRSSLDISDISSDISAVSPSLTRRPSLARIRLRSMSKVITSGIKSCAHDITSPDSDDTWLHDRMSRALGKKRSHTESSAEDSSAGEDYMDHCCPSKKIPHLPNMNRSKTAPYPYSGTAATKVGVAFSNPWSTPLKRSPTIYESPPSSDSEN